MTFLIAICFTALALGFSDAVLANYFKDAYDATAQQRGFIEFPRELPGVLSLFVIFALARLGDIKIAVIAQLLSAVGILVLAFITPSFYTMTAILFVFSMGAHMFMPLQDGIAMSLFGEKNPALGSLMGKLKGLGTVFSFISGIIIFFGFNTGVFSFKTPTKWVFVISGICFFIAALLFVSLFKKAHSNSRKVRKIKPVFRKEYKFYYILAVMNGVQKQIVLVFSPWLIIEILGQGADTMSVLIMISSFLGILFLPFLGKCLDRFGIKNMLYADALSFIIVYLALAYMAYTLSTGVFSLTGVAMFVTFFIFIVDRMSSQMGFIRTVYLNSIAHNKEEIVSTISFGISLDHVVSITCSYICGLIWTYFGPHYVFIFAASFSLINLTVAFLIPKKVDNIKKAS